MFTHFQANFDSGCCSLLSMLGVTPNSNNHNSKQGLKDCHGHALTALTELTLVAEAC